MNKILNKRLFDNNKFAVILATSLLLMMSLKNIFINIILVLAMFFLAINRTFYFLPLRFDDDKDDDYTYEIYKLIPINKHQLNIYNYLNAIIWSLCLFIASYLYLLSNNSFIHDSSRIGFLIIISLTPIFMIFQDNNISKIRHYSVGIIPIVASLIILYIPIYRKSESKIILISLILLSIIAIFSLFINLFDIKFKKILENKELGLNINNRLITINNTTRYYLKNKNRLIDYSMGFYIVIWLVNDTPLMTIISILILNAIIILGSIKEYFFNENCIRLLPISLKEKKLSCHIFTILKLILLNFGLSLLLLITEKYQLSSSIINALIISLFSSLLYALYMLVVFKDDIFLKFIIFIIFSVIAYTAYYFSNKFGILVLIPVGLITLILLICSLYINKTS